MSKVFTITEGLENLGALRTGGQGSVYKGRRTGHIITAVKLLPTPIINENNDDRNFRNFQNEVEKLKKVNEQPNPHVVKIMNSGITESGSFPFIEMEYIEGPDLCELLQPPHSPVFTIKEVIRVADQLADALAHCHKVGVKHGDIKSNNVKFNTHTGNYVLLDFGLSIMTDEQRRSSMRHAGAIEFMAPEQHEGQMLMQTDVYSYGIILYELLAGRVPFPLTDHNHSETARNTVMLAHMEAAIPDMLELRRANLPQNWDEAKRQREMQVPGWLFHIINKCLEKDPARRYANGMALHDALVNANLTSSGVDTSQGLDAVALKAENERLQARIAQYEQDEDSSSKMYISKAVFTGLMVLLILFMGFSVYSLFLKKQGYTPASTTAADSLDLKADTGTVDQLENTQDYTVPKPVDSVRRDTPRDTSRQQQRPPVSPDPDTTGTEPDTPAVESQY